MQQNKGKGKKYFPVSKLQIFNSLQDPKQLISPSSLKTLSYKQENLRRPGRGAFERAEESGGYEPRGLWQPVRRNRANAAAGVGVGLELRRARRHVEGRQEESGAAGQAGRRGRGRG